MRKFAGLALAAALLGAGMTVSAAPAMAQADAPAMGATLTRANYDGGYFVQGSGAAWTEYQGTRPVYHFREIARDDDGVTLLDSSRDTRIKFDLPRQMILVSWASGTPFQDLYPMTSAVHRADGRGAAPVPVGRPAPGYVDYGLQENFKIEAGPITTQAEAGRKCPALANRLGGSWNQGWERRDGVKSVCVIRFER